MKTGAICRREVTTVARGAAVAQAGATMGRQHVSDPVVAEECGAAKIPAGIVTDRDIVIEMIGQGLSPERIAADNVVSEFAA